MVNRLYGFVAPTWIAVAWGIVMLLMAFHYMFQLRPNWAKIMSSGGLTAALYLTGYQMTGIQEGFQFVEVHTLVNLGLVTILAFGVSLIMWAVGSHPISVTLSFVSTVLLVSCWMWCMQHYDPNRVWALAYALAEIASAFILIGGLTYAAYRAIRPHELDTVVLVPDDSVG